MERSLSNFIRAIIYFVVIGVLVFTFLAVDFFKGRDMPTFLGPK